MIWAMLIMTFTSSGEIADRNDRPIRFTLSVRT
jgi:hypothetical protein